VYCWYINEIISPSCLYNSYWLSISTAQKRKHSLLPRVHGHRESSARATWALLCRKKEEVLGLSTVGPKHIWHGLLQLMSHQEP